MQITQLPCYLISFLSSGGGPIGPVVVVCVCVCQFYTFKQVSAIAELKLCNIFCSLNRMFSYRPTIPELVFTGVMRSARSRTSSSQLELQHKIQTLDEIPELSTHNLASLTYQHQASPSIKSCWLQPKLHKGNICYIFHSIFLSVVTLAYKLQCQLVQYYSIQAPEVTGPSCQWP